MQFFLFIPYVLLYLLKWKIHNWILHIKYVLLNSYTFTLIYLNFVNWMQIVQFTFLILSAVYDMIRSQIVSKHKRYQQNHIFSDNY
jgi:hypothetical protein